MTNILQIVEDSDQLTKTEKEYFGKALQTLSNTEQEELATLITDFPTVIYGLYRNLIAKKGFANKKDNGEMFESLIQEEVDFLNKLSKASD